MNPSRLTNLAKMFIEKYYMKNNDFTDVIHYFVQ